MLHLVAVSPKSLLNHSSQGKSNGNTLLLWQLERGVYSNWQRSDIAFDLPAASLHTNQSSVLRQTAFVPHRDCSTSSASQNLFVFYICLSASTKQASCYTCKWTKGLLDRFQATGSVQLTELQIKVWALFVLWRNLHYLESLWERFLNALGWSEVFLRTVLLPLQSHYLWYCVADLIREIMQGGNLRVPQADVFLKIIFLHVQWASHKLLSRLLSFLFSPPNFCALCRTDSLSTTLCFLLDILLKQ